MTGIVWLASYPKSGNTWLRAWLTNYLGDAGTPADINALDGGPIASSREVFDELTGLEASDLTASEVERLRPAVYQALLARASKPVFMKVHDAWTSDSEGRPLVGAPEVTHAVIYLVRNPLDVAVSFAHHSASPIDAAIKTMLDDSAVFASRPGHLSAQLPQRLRSWSGHVRSWVDESGLPVCVVRYEDMVSDPVTSFTTIAMAAGLEVDSSRVNRAIQFSRFEILRAQEERTPFRERSQRARSFFRKGGTGDGRRVLSDAQRNRLVVAHGEIMRRYGYDDGVVAGEVRSSEEATAEN